MDAFAFAATKLGRYKLLRPLGAGGMAELFLARADGIEGFSKLVALKRILPHRAANERFVRMFLAEARLVAGLAHPNIAQVYDIGQEGGEYFFAMEYVHGPDLYRILREAPNHRLHLENTLHVALGLCAGLHHAHEARDDNGRSLEIVHRDVSPSNVLVSYQGAVKLVDFGVAKAATSVSETHDGVIKGKHGYMSPEQCLGEPLTRQSDVFNLGILLWEMTVGRRLYKVNGDLVALQRIVYVDAPPPSRYVRNYPPELERIVMRALARDRTKRYQTAEQLQIELEAFALEHRIPVSPVTMGLEMRGLFRERIEAWQAAQEAGKSLADHLAEISSDHAIASSEDEIAAGGIDDVIGDLATGVYDEEDLVPRMATQGERPSNIDLASSANRLHSSIVPTPPSGTTLGPASITAPETPAPAKTLAIVRPKRSRWLVFVAVVVLLAAAGFAAVLLLPGPPLASPPSDLVAVGTGSPPPPAVDNDRAIQPETITPDTPADPPPANEDTNDEITIDANEHEKPSMPSGNRRRTPKPRAKTVAKVEPKPKAPVADAKQPDPKPITTETKPKPATPNVDQLPDVHTSPKPPDAKPAVAGPKPGTVDAAGVRAVARAHIGEIETCVSRARMENRDLGGRVVIRIDVSPTGGVTRTAIAASKGSNAALEACMMKVVAAWTFPAPAGGVRGAFTYPFAF